MNEAEQKLFDALKLADQRRAQRDEALKQLEHLACCVERMQAHMENGEWTEKGRDHDCPEVQLTIRAVAVMMDMARAGGIARKLLDDPATTQ